MKPLYKYIFLLPVLLIIFEIIYCSLQNNYIKMNPISEKNKSLSTLTDILSSANLSITETKINSYQNEIEFILINNQKKSVKVILSLSKNPLAQVNALQKLLKIANIKEKEIKFIDLSSNRPYATL